MTHEILLAQHWLSPSLPTPTTGRCNVEFVPTWIQIRTCTTTDRQRALTRFMVRSHVSMLLDRDSVHANACPGMTVEEISPWRRGPRRRSRIPAEFDHSRVAAFSERRRGAIDAPMPAPYDLRAASSACGVSISRNALWPSTGTSATASACLAIK